MSESDPSWVTSTTDVVGACLEIWSVAGWLVTTDQLSDLGW